MDKKGLAWLALFANPIGVGIFVVLVAAMFISGGIFFNNLSDFFKGFTINNPLLWVVGIIVLLVLFRRRR